MKTGPTNSPCYGTMHTCLSETPLDDTTIIFDLDDTLYRERDFMRSGFAAVSAFLAQRGCRVAATEFEALLAAGSDDPFAEVLRRNDVAVDKRDLVETYRNHKPRLRLCDGVERLLARFVSNGRTLGLLTDGRSQTQRNKIEALGLDGLFTEIVISEDFGSEKPTEANYRHFEHKLPGRRYAYVGDNLAKDFVTPNRLGWTTVCVLDTGDNIHPQNFAATQPSHLPQHVIRKVA